MADGLWEQLAPPVAGLRCCVVVPARNEAALLPAALRALATQRPLAGNGPLAPYEVLVLANNCSDDTAAQAREAAAALRRDAARARTNDSAAATPLCTVHVVEVEWPPEHANVGHARGVLMAAAARRLEAAGARHGVIASTDGDSCVEPDWLAATLAEIDAGADAVGGRICTLPGTTIAAPLRRLQRLDDAYRLLRAWLEGRADPNPGDPWPRHHQHFGASLAVTVSAFRRVGGLPKVAWLEDEALVQALWRSGCTVRHSPLVRVRTSARLDGRAAVGLSWQLRQWSEQAQCSELPLVPHPESEWRRWRLRGRMRLRWRATGKTDAAAFDAAWRQLGERLDARDRLVGGVRLDVAVEWLRLQRHAARL